MSNISSNVERVRQQVGEAARRSGRDPSMVTIIAVTKTRTLDEVAAVIEAGISDLGENRAQELREKQPHFQGATWHLVGTLQTNKVKPVLSMTNLIHSLDRPSLALALAKEAERRQAPCDALVQVNVSGEESKHGVAPTDLHGFLRSISQRGHVRIRGLMTMAPLDADPAQARPYFRRLRELAEAARLLRLPNIDLQHLSMGMSGDFTAAVEEGATMVRVGTALFGPRQQPTSFDESMPLAP